MCSAILLYTLNSAALSFGSFCSTLASSAFFKAASRAGFPSRISFSLSHGSASLLTSARSFFAISAMMVLKSCREGAAQVKVLRQVGCSRLGTCRMRGVWVCVCAIEARGRLVRRSVRR